MMHRREVALTDDLMIAGYHVAVPAVDVHTVGAGAEPSRPWMPRDYQAGTTGRRRLPWTACYGPGRHPATVTDALWCSGA